MKKLNMTFKGLGLLAVSLLGAVLSISCDDSSSATDSSRETSVEPDTVYVRDTVRIIKVVDQDSLVLDSIEIRDSLNIKDSLNIRDSVNVLDTVLHDTTTVFDTVEVAVHDTVSIHDTLSTGCFVENNDDGTVKVTCNDSTLMLYPALCGGVFYDAETQACVNDSVVDMCGAKPYDKDKQICDNGIVFDVIRDSRDQKAYRTVTIGEQTWMAENLNYSVSNSVCGGGSTSVPNGDCDTFGRLYTWSAALKIDPENDSIKVDVPTPVQGICPTGWHLPDIAEWQALYDTIMAERPTVDFDVQMRADSVWNYTDMWFSTDVPAEKGQNLVGMNILPSGRASARNDSLVYYDTHTLAYFVAVGYNYSETHTIYAAFYNHIMNGLPYMLPNKSNGLLKSGRQFAVRCVMD